MKFLPESQTKGYLLSQKGFQALKKLTFIKGIHFEFVYLGQATQKGVEKLLGSFHCLSQLEDLTLPEGFEMSDQSLAKIDFKRLVSLQNVHFVF